MKKLNKETKEYIYALICFIAMLILLLFSLSSCSTFDWIYKTANDNLEITWKKENSKKVIDSLLINNKSTYFIINCDTLDYEKDFELTGYKIWLLKIDNKFRIEVAKTDSLIYLYGK